MSDLNEAYISSMSMSKNEMNYALALVKLDILFQQQVPLGVKGTRGSQYIDLVAQVPPKPAAIFIQGGYWHKQATATEDQMKQAAAEQAGYWVVEVKEEESDTEENALRHARRTFL